MALDVRTAALIVGAVFKDAECRKVIPTRSIQSTPSSGRGWKRNLKYFLRGKDPEKDAYTADRVCTGIARLTSEAIARKKFEKKLKEVKRPQPTDERSFLGFLHTATLITMQDDSNYVFDWHATLDILNPLLFPSHNSWKRDEGGLYYIEFQGWA